MRKCSILIPEATTSSRKTTWRDSRLPSYKGPKARTLLRKNFQVLQEQTKAIAEQQQRMANANGDGRQQQPEKKERRSSRKEEVPPGTRTPVETSSSCIGNQSGSGIRNSSRDLHLNARSLHLPINPETLPGAAIKREDGRKAFDSSGQKRSELQGFEQPGAKAGGLGRSGGSAGGIGVESQKQSPTRPADEKEGGERGRKTEWRQNPHRSTAASADGRGRRRFERRRGPSAPQRRDVASQRSRAKTA